MFFQYLVISVVLVAFLLAISWLIEGEISKLVIITIFVLVIVYGYFFNESTEKIIEASFAQRKANEALEELTTNLEEKVDAQTRDLRAQNRLQVNLTHALEQANLRLQKLDKQKTDFLSIASHQLRTPLSIFKGYIELIKDGAYGHASPEMKEILNNFEINNEHLIKLVDEFLNVSRIEQGRTNWAFARHNLAGLIGETINELKAKAAVKKMEIIWHGLAGPSEAVMDREKIYHVVYNFVDNAIKYSDQGKVSVALKKEGDGYALRVKDEGIGFGKVDGANFFQKFYRGENVKGINVNGTGLGLYICAKFIEGHHGRIWARSRGLGKGSEFGFWIPVKPTKAG